MLFWFVCALLYSKRVAYPQIRWWHHWWWPQRGHAGPRCLTGREPEGLGQHMAHRVSGSPPQALLLPLRLSFFSTSFFSFHFFKTSSLFLLSALHLKTLFTALSWHTITHQCFLITVECLRALKDSSVTFVSSGLLLWFANLPMFWHICLWDFSAIPKQWGSVEFRLCYSPCQKSSTATSLPRELNILDNKQNTLSTVS